MNGIKALDPEIAGYRFKKPSLLEEALTHPSLAGRINYQRLEFLGDRVIALVISEWLLDTFPEEAEGRLNRRLVSLVRGETLAMMADKVGFTERMLLTPGAETEGTRKKTAIRADVFEAVIGAMYLDGGLEVVRAFIHEQFADLMADGPNVSKDAKTRLQEWAQKRGKPLPTYEIVERSGPDHDPQFIVRASLKDTGSAEGDGRSRKLAEQAAASLLFQKLAG